MSVFTANKITTLCTTYTLKGKEDDIEKNPSDKCTCGFFLRLFSCLKDFPLFRGRRDNNCLHFEPTSYETRRILLTVRTRVQRAPPLSSASLFVFFVFFYLKQILSHSYPSKSDNYRSGVRKRIKDTTYLYAHYSYVLKTRVYS